MRKIVLTCFLFLSLCVNANSFERIVVFGDSLSDTGNLYDYMLHLVPKSPPYYKGHFSNGPVWTERVYEHYFLSAHDEHKHNYAAGGAPAVVDGTNTLPFSLTTEVDDYLYLHEDHKKDKTLFLIWIGGNNYIKNPGHHEEITTKSVEGIAKNIRLLMKNGAKSFLIPNLPDLGHIPEAIEGHKTGALTEMALAHNKKLHDMIEGLRQAHPDVLFIEFDVKRIFDDVLSHPENYGISQTKEACYKGSVFLSLPSDEQLASYLEKNGVNQSIKVSKKMIDSILKTPVLKEVAKVDWLWASSHKSHTPECQGYLFFDGIHPTSYVHSHVAEYAINEIEKAGLTFRKA